ncbi:MFS transporter [Edaphobacter bradus]|uniref:MFS transporter n=1 Tax=Edaphobacter bradus TaxID=2259016 RepID=UPI0021E0BDED|nr:MFS transporter [Edaphobacter bradus]
MTGTAASGVAITGQAVDGRALYRRITWRLIPFLFLLYIVAYVDRVNVGFAAMDMKRQLNFSDTVYGTGAGIFFLGYSLFDLPSNLLMRRVGTRVWIARIMITWGLVAALMVFVSSPRSFYTMRFLLGVAEAGFVPGMLLYLTYWFPSHERARAVAKFMTATSLAGVVGGPLSSALLKLDGVAGLEGWQWLFVAEGIPTVLLGVLVLFVLKDGPENASWLRPEERQWLASELERDRSMYGATEHHTLGDAFRMPAVWMLAAVYVAIQIGVYIVNLWMPLILSNIGGGAHDVGLIARFSTVPYLLAALFTVIVGWSSDRLNERRGHLAGCMALAAAGFAWAAVAHSIPVALCAMSLAAIGLWSTMGPFWALMTRTVAGTAAAGGVAMITTLGGLGGFIGPYVTGRLKDATHSFSGGLYAMGALALGAALLSLAVRQRKLV